MASGTIKGTFTNLSASHLYPEIRWRSTKNDTNNNSSVTAELWFVRVNTAYISNNAYFLPRITINGDAAYPPSGTYAPFDVRKGTHKVWQRTVTVAHNADGAKSITIAAGGITGLSNLGNVSVSGTAKLDQIPRASSIGTISGNQIGSAITIPISRASGSFTHDVSLKLGNKTVSATGVGTSATLTPGLADFCGQLTSSTSGTAVVTVVTKSGSTTIGTKTKNHTIYVPSGVVPNAKTLNIAERVSAVSSLGLTKTFVQNKSTIGLTASADGIYGSTIKDYTFTFNGRSQGGTVGRDFAVGTASAGNHTVTVTVTDSRGRKASRSDTVSVVAYSMPNITKFDVARDGATLKVKTNITTSVHNIASKGGSWKVQRANGNTWVNVDNGTFTTSYTTTGKILTGDYDDTKSFNFRLVVSDAFGEGAILIKNVSTTETLLDLNKNEGIGIGKMHENGALDVGGDTHIKGNLFIDGTASRLKSTINWTVPNASATGVFTHLYRNNGKMLSALYHSTGDDTLGMNMYDQNGNYKINKFLPDGGVNFAGRIWSGSYITATRYVEGTGFQQRMSDGSAQEIYTTRPNGVLWSGTLWMNSDQTLTLPKTIDQAPNGWIIVMQAYANGKVTNRDFTYTVLHKSHPSVGFHVPFYWNYGDAMAGRYMYLDDRNKLRGSRTHPINSPKGGGIVMSKVIEF